MNQNEQSNNKQAENLIDLPLDDEQAEQAKGGSRGSTSSDLSVSLSDLGNKAVESTAGELASHLQGPSGVG